MLYRINAIIAYAKGGWSTYTAILDEDGHKEFPETDSDEEIELFSWPKFRALFPSASLPPASSVAHISDITFNVGSMGETKNDITSANEDVVVGDVLTSSSSVAKHRDLINYTKTPFYYAPAVPPLPPCEDDDALVAPFTCASAVATFGCDFIWGGLRIGDLCPVTCDECP